VGLASGSRLPYPPGMPTEPAVRMATLIASVGPVLREAGFRKRRHAFNRVAEPGIVHVLDFQMGPFEPPGTPEIPPWRRNLYGQFTINVGVFVAEVAEAFAGVAADAFVPEYRCEIRARIGRLVVPRPPEDLWFRLDEDPAALEATIRDLLTGAALPFLGGLRDRASIVDAWARGDLAGLMPPRGPLAIAVILRGLGDIERARAMTREYLERPDHHPGHLDWARRVAIELDLG
jgi:Domain of unknown function (DUF4304)